MSDFFEVNEGNFDTEVLKHPIPVLVEFGAPWCAPCKQLEPFLKQLGTEWAGKVRLVKVNVDESLDLTTRYGIMSVPTVMLFKGGAMVERVTGFQPKAKLELKFNPHLA